MMRLSHRAARELLLAYCLLASSLGCDGEALTEEGGEAGNGGGGGEGESPRDGLWSYVDGGVIENTCGSDDVTLDDDTTFEIVNTGGSTFLIPQNAPHEEFACTKTGDTFTCPARLKGEQPIDMTDVVLSYVVDVSGTLEDAETMSGTQRAHIACAGSQCSLASTLGYTFPCYYVVEFDATFQADY